MLLLYILLNVNLLCLVTPPALKKLNRHIAFALFVHVFVYSSHFTSQCKIGQKVFELRHMW